MSKGSLESNSGFSEKFMLSSAVVLIFLGCALFFFLKTSFLMRSSILAVSFFIALILAAFSAQGKIFLQFAKDSIHEAKKVVWPTSSETLSVTAIIFLFVLIMAIFLWIVDQFSNFIIYNLILGWK